VPGFLQVAIAATARPGPCSSPKVRHYLKDVDKPRPGRGRTESMLTSGAKRFQHRPYAIGACRRERRVPSMLPRLFRTPTFMPASPPVISLPALEASRDAS
jgi:hypothetical protein